jgi:hypothetical protein
LEDLIIATFRIKKVPPVMGITFVLPVKNFLDKGGALLYTGI